MSRIIAWWNSLVSCKRVLPRSYRERPCQRDAWALLFPAAVYQVDDVLSSLCDAFNFSREQRYQFAPSDSVVEVYRACYPRWKIWNLGDSMELETFVLELDRNFNLDVQNFRGELTLREIVVSILAAQASLDDESRNR